MSGGLGWWLAIIRLGLKDPAHRHGWGDRRFPDNFLVQNVPDACGSPLNAGSVPVVERHPGVMLETVLGGPANAVVVGGDGAVETSRRKAGLALLPLV